MAIQNNLKTMLVINLFAKEATAFQTETESRNFEYKWCETWIPRHEWHNQEALWQNEIGYLVIFWSDGSIKTQCTSVQHLVLVVPRIKTFFLKPLTSTWLSWFTGQYRQLDHCISRWGVANSNVITIYKKTFKAKTIHHNATSSQPIYIQKQIARTHIPKDLRFPNLK